VAAFSTAVPPLDGAVFAAVVNGGSAYAALAARPRNESAVAVAMRRRITCLV
jgi:hypothetical protein